MNHDDLNHWSKRAADWAQTYHATLRDRPVRAPLEPGALLAALPARAPDAPEPIEALMQDFVDLIPDRMTHWQHPRFFAYFPANASPASMLAEQLANAMAGQGMLWQTSPAMTELEIAMIRWLVDAMGLPAHFTGLIHDSATTTTLAALVTMRERATEFASNQAGLFGQARLRVYASNQTHNSVDRGMRIAGLGLDNLVKIPVRNDLSMDPVALAAAIAADRAAGHIPAGVVLACGGTSVGAFDDIRAAIKVAKDAGLYVHVDAAWAGSAMICPEFRHLWDGVAGADSIVFNPHKWLGVQFDCAVQFLADHRPQVAALTHQASYLETPDAVGMDAVADFSGWTVPLGRRFRALKLWFTLRAYGLDGLRARIRNHVAWAGELCDALRSIDGVEIVTEPHLSLFTFALTNETATARLLEAINNDGRIYLTQTRHFGRYVIRVQVGQFDCTRDDVMMVETVVRDLM